MKAILILKGPSAARADEVCEKLRPEIIATVNDSSLLLKKTPRIDYCFFTHLTRVGIPSESRIPESLAVKIDTFVSPEFAKQHPDNRWLLDGQYKWLTYEDHACSYVLENIHHRILSGGIVHHHTTSGAIHWLCKYRCLKTLYVLGMDGGGRSNYAPGMIGAMNTHDDLLNEFKRANETIIPVLQRVYGVQIEVLS